MGQALGCVKVRESNVAIREKCGKYKDVLKPGFHYVPWCCGYNIVGKLPLSLQPLDIRCETKTKDNVSVTVYASVKYRLGALKEEEDKGKAKDAFYNPTKAKTQIRVCVVEVIWEKLPKLSLDEAIDQKNEITRAVEAKFKQDLPPLGYEIETLIIDMEPDVKVKTEMNEKGAAAIKAVKVRAEIELQNEHAKADIEIQTERAKADIEIQTERAKADIEIQTERAKADIEMQTERAKADAESKYQLGLGIARQRKAIVDGLRESVHAFTERVPGTTGKDVIDMEIVTQYFDTMKEIGTSSKASHVFLLHGPDVVKDLSSRIREDLLLKDDK